jgi:hypothetical protein
MAVMRMVRELASELRIGMAVMRRLALPQAAALRIVSFADAPEYPPRITGAQHVPLWKIAGPHTGKLKPGPSRGPVFYRALLKMPTRAARAVDVILAPRRHPIVFATIV